MAKYATSDAMATTAARATKIPCSRFDFFFVDVTGGDDVRSSESTGAGLGLTAARGAGRLAGRFTLVFGAIGAGSAVTDGFDVSVLVAGLGFDGADAVRAFATRARISLRSARDGFLLTIRRYSMRVRSGKTPALWGVKPGCRHNLTLTS